jgi:threonine/homoserine/homoserine lactone efflux protein
MSLQTTLAFVAAFFLLAVSPGPGLVAILSRALGGGMRSGYAVMSGLVLGDALFLGIAMVGLSTIATTFGPLFQAVKYAGAAYLLWLGVKALRASAAPLEVSARSAQPLWKDAALGLFVTLGNPKPILFYGALLPTFLDMSRASVHDFLLMMAVVVVVSTVVYGAYMLMLERARHLLASGNMARRVDQATGVMLIGSGLVVATR